jgi:hypothetical protein
VLLLAIRPICLHLIFWHLRCAQVAMFGDAASRITKWTISRSSHRLQGPGNHSLKNAYSSDASAPGGRDMSLKQKLLCESSLSRPSGPKPEARERDWERVSWFMKMLIYEFRGEKRICEMKSVVSVIPQGICKRFCLACRALNSEQTPQTQKNDATQESFLICSRRIQVRYFLAAHLFFIASEILLRPAADIFRSFRPPRLPFPLALSSNRLIALRILSRLSSNSLTIAWVSIR